MSTPNERRKALLDAFKSLPELDQTALVGIAQYLAQLWVSIKAKPQPKLKTYSAVFNGKRTRGACDAHNLPDCVTCKTGLYCK